MDLKNLLKESDSAEGKWFTIEDAEFLIAPAGRKWEVRFAKLNDLWQKKHRNREPNPEQRMALNIEATVGTCLLGWRGLQDNGQEIPFSVEKGVELLNNYPAIRKFVLETARTDSEFMAPQEGEDGAEVEAENPEKAAEAALKSGSPVVPPLE